MLWVIGDVHGMLRPLEALVDAVDDADPAAELVFVGDYVNRGPDSRGVMEFVTDIDGAHFCRGNHDDVLDLILHGQSLAAQLQFSTRAQAAVAFLQHGLDDTLLSYGVTPFDIATITPGIEDHQLDTILSVIPRAHRAFLRTLPAAFERDELFVCHASHDPNEPDTPGFAERARRDPRVAARLIWRRFREDQILQVKAWRRNGVFGHTPVDAYSPELRQAGMFPVVGPNIALIDTACALQETGRLTALCPEARSMIQVDRAGRVVR